MKKVPILMYHKIGLPKPGQRYRNLSVSPRRFAAQVKWLKKRGYQAVTFSQLKSGALPEKPVVLTFDDGYADFYREALPVLAAAGFPAVVYVVAGLAGKTNEWSRGRNDVEEPLLTWEQMRELQGKGIEIGSHAMSHTELFKDDPDLLEREMGGSKRFIEEKLGRPVVSFAWPGGTGAGSAAQRAFLARCGYSYACRADGGLETWPPEDPLALRRVAVKGKHNILAFAWNLGALW